MSHREAGTTVTLEIHQEKFLSGQDGEQEMHAILTVGVEGSGGGRGAPGLAEVLVVDCSSSMTWPDLGKFRAAKAAASAALGMLPDGAPFAVVKGTDTAEMAYPAVVAMPQATEALREEAQAAVYDLPAVGGTAIGTWLDLARRLLAGQSAPIRHVLLLTDGHNVHDGQLPLSDVLDACDGQFVCDAWGIGDGWDARELLRIASRLHGSANAVREEAALVAEYRALMARMLAKSVPGLAIRVTPSPGSTVRYLRQVHPTETELTGLPGPDGRSTTFLTRAWGDEARRFQLCLTADPAGRPRGVDMQLAAVGVEVPGGSDGPGGSGGSKGPGGSDGSDVEGSGGRRGDGFGDGFGDGRGDRSRGGRGQARGKHDGDGTAGRPASIGSGGGNGSGTGGGPRDLPGGADLRLPVDRACIVHWTDDPVLPRPPHSHVQHFQAYQRLGAAAARADDAYRRGETARAEQYLGQALRIAYDLPDRRLLGQLERIVDVQDPAAGRVRLRPGAEPIDFQHLITSSSHSTFGPDAPGAISPAGAAPGPDGTVSCPGCGEPAPLDAAYCPWCRHRMTGRP